MNAKQRVAAVIEGKPFDRLPVYGWLRANLEKPISAAFGSVEQFEDRYEFDLAHIFGGPGMFAEDTLDQARRQKGEELTPGDLLDLPVTDVNDADFWRQVQKDIRFYGDERSRFTYMQTPGIFEATNGWLGLENHLMDMLLYPDELAAFYRRLAAWNVAFAHHAMDLGIDMIHVSDDWGAQRGLLFSPQLWREMIAPCHRQMVEAVHARGRYASLHSDGNISQILGDICRLGYNVLHPYQTSAGMNYQTYLDTYAGNFTIMGGLDIQETLGFGQYDRLKAEIESVVSTFSRRGILLCTTHFVQDHCSIDELTYAYDLIYRIIRK